MNKIKFSKNDFDHVDFAVPARIKNLTCWTTALVVCWSVHLRTFTTAVKREHWQNSSLSLTCYRTSDFNFELEIYARQDFPFFEAGSNF
jgi:hypothetical protein